MEKLFAALWFFLVCVSQADGSDMSDYLYQKISDTSEALNGFRKISNDESPDLLESPHWNFQNFYLRLQATAGFKIPPFVRLTVVPNIELVWHKVPDHK